MTPARSLAASVVALGFAGTVAAPLPASAAPIPCERSENYAAQSGAEALRIDKLEFRPGDQTQDQTEPGTGGMGAADGLIGPGVTNLDPTTDSGEDADTLSEGIGILGEAVLDSVDPHGLIPRASAEPFSGGQGGGEEADTVSVPKVGFGEARTALIGSADVKSAAIARILDGKTDDAQAAWTKPVVQQAPPTNAKAATRSAGGGEAGPLGIKGGNISAHAQWDDEWACGDASATDSASGEAARSQAVVRGANILGGALVRVPEKLTGLSTTALEGSGEATRSVASSTVTAGRIELAGGRVKVRILQPPSLVAGMDANGDGDIKYAPAVIEVSGAGIATKRLSAAGESAEFTLKPDRRMAEPDLLESARLGSSGSRSGGSGSGGSPSGGSGSGGSRSGGLGSGLGGLGSGSALPLPHIPGVPEVTLPPVVGGNPAESGSVAGSTWVRVSLGEPRRANKDHAIAARATAVSISMEQSGMTESKSVESDKFGSNDYDGNDKSGDVKAGGDKRDSDNKSNSDKANGGWSNSDRDNGGKSHGGSYDSGTKPGGGSNGGGDKSGSGVKPGSGHNPSGGNKSDGGDKSGGQVKPGYVGPGGSVSVSLGFGLLEAAAVAPGQETPADTTGGAGGLPITGPQAGGLAVGGAALLVTGAVAVLLSVRRRRTRQ